MKRKPGRHHPVWKDRQRHNDTNNPTLLTKSFDPFNNFTHVRSLEGTNVRCVRFYVVKNRSGESKIAAAELAIKEKKNRTKVDPIFFHL